MAEQERTDLEGKDDKKCKRSLRPPTQDIHHQDSLFGNSFQAKSYFTVHPEWLSESVSGPESVPLNRPPWPWEQPRYRQNVQIPITYDPPAADNGQEAGQEGELQVETVEGEASKTPPLPYSLPTSYCFTQPLFEEARPLRTQFGAPLVDTSTYKLNY